MQVYLSAEKLEEPAVEVEGIRTILVKDKHGNPIFLAIQQTEDHIWYVTPDDPKFSTMLEQLGISKRVTIKKTMGE